MTQPTHTVSHYGVVRFGDLECEAVVLLGGKRGYISRQIANLLGFQDRQRGDRFTRFLAETEPNILIELEKKGGPILLPSGHRSLFFPAGIIPRVVTSVVEAAFESSALQLGLITEELEVA